MKIPGGLTLAIGVLCTFSVSSSAQTYKELISFNGNSAAGPKSPLTQGLDGNLYGMTYYGGTGTCSDGDGIGCGVIFRITPSGAFKILYNFQNDSNLYWPATQLTLGNDGNFYGCAQNTAFKITPAGVITTLVTFSGNNGYGPQGLTLGADGNFYGVTEEGGTPSEFCPSACGTIFKMTPAGVVTSLYSFCQQNYCPDGKYPTGLLAQGADGDFYGTTSQEGLYHLGTIFKISPAGVFSVAYTFQQYGAYPGGLIVGSDGNLYGTGAYFFVFRLTPQGIYTTLSLPDELGTSNPIIQATDGNLYGTVQQGEGAIYDMSTTGSGASLYTFTGYPDDGSDPRAALVQSTNGKFYGTAYSGGGSPCNFGNFPGCGTVFSLDNGLAPFVSFVQQAGRPGGTAEMLGQGFTGATAVSFNGTPATFIVRRDTFLMATVPAGATTGSVNVTTPTGTLTSNVPFHVLP